MSSFRQRPSRAKRTKNSSRFSPDVVPARNVVVSDAPGPSAGEACRKNAPGGASTATGPDAAPTAATIIADGVPTAQKVKGAVQMAGGAALVIAGVPMCVLPGPGAAAIAGGAALASKGQRNFSGRAATPVEEKLDAAAAKIGEVAKDQTVQAARTAARKAPEVAGKATRVVAQQAPVIARHMAETVPAVASQVAKAAPVAAERVAEAAPKVAEHVAEAAPKVAERVAGIVPGMANRTAKASRAAYVTVRQDERPGEASGKADLGA